MWQIDYEFTRFDIYFYFQKHAFFTFIETKRHHPPNWLSISSYISELMLEKLGDVYVYASDLRFSAVITQK